MSSKGLLKLTVKSTNLIEGGLLVLIMQTEIVRGAFPILKKESRTIYGSPTGPKINTSQCNDNREDLLESNVQSIRTSTLSKQLCTLWQRL